MPGTVQRWTGRESRALRHALRMSVRVFAAHLGVTDRAVSKWEAGNGDRVPGPDSQAILDTVFEQADENARARFWEELGQRPVEPVRGVTMVPDMDPAMIARPDLQALVDIVLEASAAASGHVVAIAGPGGFGKTTLATQAVHDARIREAFPEILWVETGEDCSPTQGAHLISDLCFHLDGTRPELSDPEQAGFHLARVVGDRKMLLVIDNVWSGADLSPFLMGGPSCVRVATTRNIRVTPTRARVLKLGPMRQDEIAELLRRTVPDASSSMLGPVAALCGGWPLLATLVGASVSGDVSAGATTQQALDIVSRALRAQGPQALDVWDTDQRKVAISHVISTTLRALDDSVRIPGVSDLSDRYLSLAVFPAVTPIPLEVLSRWWGAAHDWNSVAVRQFCKVLADRSLLSAYRADSDVVVLHDVFRAYLRGLVAHALPDLHQSLLDSLRPAAGWADLPRSRTYEWTHLAYHLAESGDVQEVAGVLGDARYVIGKAAVCGAHTLRADRDIVAEVQAAMTSAEGGADLHRAFQITSLGYLLHGQHAEPDMAATLQVALAKDGLDDGGLAAAAEQAGVVLRWALPAEDHGSNGHVGTIVSVAATGDLLVSGGEDGLVRVWDLSGRRLIRSLRGHTGWVHAVAISPDGATIASAGEDNVILFWSAADGTQVGMLAGHDKRIRALAFRRHAPELISGAEDGLVRAWDLRTLALARQASTRGTGIWSVSLPDDETMVAASGEDEYVRLFDLATGGLLDEAALHRAWVRSVQFLPGGHRLISAAADGTARTWDTSARHLKPGSILDAAGERLRAVTYHDSRIVTAGEDATVRTYGDDAAQAQMPAGINWVRTIASTGQGVAVGCEDGSLRLWDPREPGSNHVIAPGRNTTWSAAFADGGQRLALGQADGTVRLHDAATGTEISVLPAGTGRVWALASADPYVSAACGDGRLRVWQGTEPILELNQDVLLTWAVAISEDGRHLVASDTNGRVRMWSLPDGALQWDQEAKAGRVRSLSVSAEANIVAAAGGDGVVRTWDLSTGDERATISVPGWARAVALGHQGTRIAVGAGTGDIYLYDEASAEPSATLAGHRGRVLMLGFSVSDALLVSAAADGTVRRWSLNGSGSTAQVRVDASAQCASYDPSTGHAAVASAAGTILLHVADPG